MWKTKTFPSREKMNAFLARRGHRIEWQEIFLNNAWGIIYRPLRNL